MIPIVISIGIIIARLFLGTRIMVSRRFVVGRIAIVYDYVSVPIFPVTNIAPLIAHDVFVTAHTPIIVRVTADFFSTLAAAGATAVATAVVFTV